MAADIILSILWGGQHSRLRPIVHKIFLLAVIVPLMGCAYRFTNLAMTPPAGITSISVEGVYDTSEDVLPHEYLWNAVQQALAANGRMRLTSQDRADAILRIHMKRGHEAPSGTVVRDAVAKDPKITDSANVPPPDAFKRLTRAGAWTLEEILDLTVEVEVYRIEDRKLIFKSSYSDNTTFKSQRSQDLAQANTQFLLYEESLGASFVLLSKRIADKIVADLLL